MVNEEFGGRWHLILLAAYTIHRCQLAGSKAIFLTVSYSIIVLEDVPQKSYLYLLALLEVACAVQLRK